jgi:hypothetical protein
MITVAGGILLAMIILAILPEIGAFLGTIFGIAILAGIGYLAFSNIEATITVVAVIIIAFYFYHRKYSKREEARKLFKEIGVNEKLRKIYERIGELLLEVSNGNEKYLKRTINLPHFEINLSYSFGSLLSNSRYDMNFKKKGKPLSTEAYDCRWDWLPNKLNADEVFILDSELKQYIEKTMDSDIKAGKSRIGNGIGFFEDAKKFESGDSKILIYQHLLTQKGIHALRPVMCVGELIAEISFYYEGAEVFVYIGNELVAKIQADKWNSMRKSGKLQFASELQR